MMPETTIPTYLADELIKAAGDMSDEGIDAETEDIIRNTLISSYTVTPEIRFYLGKRDTAGDFIRPFSTDTATTKSVMCQFRIQMKWKKTLRLTPRAK